MTLNITVTTPRCIYQSADYRLLDLQTRKTADFQIQKVVLVNAFRWSATVCFAGVGRTQALNVGDWLAERVAAVQLRDPFERLIEEVLTADSWLSAVPAPYNKHSFSIGAFVGSEPVFVLISNFEQPSGMIAQTAAASLSVFQLRPTKPKTFISGQSRAVSRADRRRLAVLAERDPDPQRMYSVLTEVNRRVAKQTALVSPACFTSHLRFTGEGGGSVHDLGDRPFAPMFALPEVARTAITRLLDEQFGPGRAQLVGMSMVRSDSSDEYHEIQLREKPGDPNVHTNYGAYLKDKKGDLEGAEREYRKAIELDGNFAAALGNLANLFWEKKDKVRAADLYRRALRAKPGDENATWNYARFLVSEFNDYAAARVVVEQASAAHPESRRLLLLRGELCLRTGDFLDALDRYRQAREKGADQAAVEAGYAMALQLSGAPVGECIGAYRVAISLSPQNSGLRLNLAQLMFIKGEDSEANALLHEAMKLGLDEPAQLEAQFYMLAHISCNPADVFRTVKSLLDRGTRLRWNVRSNIDRVAHSNPTSAARPGVMFGALRGRFAGCDSGNS